MADSGWPSSARRRRRASSSLKALWKNTSSRTGDSASRSLGSGSPFASSEADTASAEAGRHFGDWTPPINRRKQHEERLWEGGKEESSGLNAWEAF